MVNFLKRRFLTLSNSLSEIPYPFLFSEQFMSTFTQLESWEMFLDMIQDQFVSEDKLSQLFATKKEIRELTGFESWGEMKQKAEEIYYERYPYGIQPMY